MHIFSFIRYCTAKLFSPKWFESPSNRCLILWLKNEHAYQLSVYLTYTQIETRTQGRSPESSLWHFCNRLNCILWLLCSLIYPLFLWEEAVPQYIKHILESSALSIFILPSVIQYIVKKNGNLGLQFLRLLELTIMWTNCMSGRHYN